ncbi:adhesion G-protein coupled receptor V1-like [Sycon ciliatum]|uniref:adhesion G-protein coupled receptor V1-like n=1 Tax=Sycon ciliatum TaxID=27933 RepID=UPI0031F65E2F
MAGTSRHKRSTLGVQTSQRLLLLQATVACLSFLAPCLAQEGITPQVFFNPTTYSVLEVNSLSAASVTLERTLEILPCTVFLTVVNNTQSGFHTTSFVDNFAFGSSTLTMSLGLMDDAIPEPDQTIAVSITSVSSGFMIGSPATAYVTILANDDPYGVLDFVSPTTAIVPEPASGGTPVTFNVVRTKGLFNTVGATWTVTSTSPLTSISPTSDTLSFAPNATMDSVTINVLADNIPEQDQTFTITLTSPTGGAILGTVVSVTVTVPRNDAPIYFSTTSVTADEGTSASLSLVRGKDPSGVSFGDISAAATVKYRTISGTAVGGQDYPVVTSGTATFAPNTGTTSISIPITDDSDPEVSESFQIEIFNSSLNCVVEDPSMATVTITANDDPNGVVGFQFVGLSTVLSEDAISRTASFPITRSRGAFGAIVVSWILENSDGSPLTSQFVATAGAVTLGPSVTSGSIDVTLLADAVPEEAMRYTLRLVNVTGGGRLASSSETALITVSDSDDAYGVVSFAPDSSQSISSVPRQVNLQLTRSGGLIGSLSVTYSVVYVPPGRPVTDGTSIFNPSQPAAATFSPGAMSFSASLGIASGSVLEVGGQVVATLSAVQLTSTTPTSSLALYSPTIGSRSRVFLTINSSLANGPIGFASSSQNVRVNESSSAQDVNLQLTRQGSSGQAIISWSIIGVSSSFTAGDVAATSGTVQMDDGKDTATLRITITSDAMPELDEQFLVNLTTIQPSSQRINPLASSATVIILNNDNPGGFVSFDPTGPVSVTATEGSSTNIILKRTGGTLDARIVDVIVSNLQATGTGDVVPTLKRVIFAAGTDTKVVSLLVSDDATPELEETFNVQLSTAGLPSGFAATLISPSAVTLVVPKNDDANGVLALSPKTQIVSESTATTTYSRNFTVTRTGGLFGVVSAVWNVTDGLQFGDDLEPSSGTVTFADQQATASFTISSKQDELTEISETFTISLTSTSGGARLSSDPADLSASLLVRANDDDVFFLPPDIVSVNEDASNVTLFVRRGNQANGIAVVRYATINGTAFAGQDFPGVSDGQVTFADGVQTIPIVVQITNDPIPEREEMFTVILLSVSGDAVLSGQTVITVIIPANDDTNGVIQFAPTSRSKVVPEGDVASFMLERLGGTFNAVVVSWVVNPPTGDVLGPATSGTVQFLQGSDTARLNLTVVADNVPELQEAFTVSLVAVLSGGARLASTGLMANLTVPENDDTNGVISIPSSSAALFVDEDRPNNLSSTGSVTISVQRQRGLFGTVRVAWELVPSGTPTVQSFVGLLLAGTARSAVTTAASRPGTSGLALDFPGSGADSLLEVAQALQLSSDTINTGFSIVCWLKLRTPGYVFAKLNNAGQVVYGLSVTAQDLTFVYLPSSASTSQSVTSPTSSTLLNNGAWHQIAISVGGGGVSFFVNAARVGQSPSPLSASVADVAGVLYVGAQNGLGGNAIDGVLQDLRVYQGILDVGALQSLAMNAASSDFQPTSGYVQFNNATDLASFSVSTVDDTISEPEETFTARLLYVSGGATFDVDATKTMATVTVYKSDNANGLFALSSSSKTRTLSEGSSTSVVVVRTLGLTGSVRVSWRVSLPGSSAPAAADFQPASGSVTFSPGDTNMTVLINAVNDIIPELDEQFDFFLTNTEVLNEPASRTSTSGASLDSANIDASVTISANDDPYGIFEFSAGIPSTSGTFIPASSAAPSLELRESAGLVDIYVVRAQGTVGNASVEYSTSPGTAVGDGASPDYTPTASRLEFAGGQLFSKFQLRINDDAIPELAKNFTLELTNPQGVPQAPLLGVGRVMAINLLPSDDAFGVVRFHSQSLSIITDETAATASLTVMRDGGLLGPITVSWMANVSAGGDLSPLSGNVTLAANVATATFSVNIIDDPTPEAAELFYIRLVAVYGGGRLSSTGGTVATLTVESSDDPHGAFQFTPTSQMYAIPETTGAVATLTVERLFGRMGEVELNYTTGLDTSAVANLRALPGVDYLHTSGTLVFADNETVRTLNVTILVDTTPEVDETFRVALGGVRLLSTPGTPPAQNSPRLASPGATAVVNINSNDDAFGVVEFSAAALTITEPATPPVITVYRRAGSFGDIVVTWRATGGTALGDIDFYPLTGTLTMLENATSASIPLIIENDSIPEFDETFTIAIENVAGGARIGPVSSALVTIAANDDPNGAFGFGTSSLTQSFSEPTGTGTTAVTLTVERSGGSVGVVSVSYAVTMADGSPASADIAPVSGTLHFTTAERSQPLVLTIQPDIIPEIDEVIQVRLVSAMLSTGASVRVDSMLDVANITIFANDRPYGIVEFSPTTVYSIAEGSSDRSLDLSIFRSEGTFGDLMVTYSTRALDLAGVVAALGSTSLDYFTRTSGQCVNGVSTLIRSANVSHCANQCLSMPSCLSFCYFTDTNCRLFTVVSGASPLVSSTLYNSSSRTALLRAQAQANLDFTLVTGSSVVIPAGQRQANVMATILADSTPELTEYFAVDLQSVSLVSGPAAIAANEPILGTSQSASVGITGNDAANGVFVIYATNDNSQTIRVDEQPNFALSMTVERLFGSIGDVTIRYSAVNGTAGSGSDFSVPTTDFFFADGVTKRSFFIQLKEDLIPEPDESFQVVLSSPTGGASVAASPNNSVTVVIADNDLAAGRVALAASSQSAIVSEGESFSLSVERSVASFGTVRVFWELTSMELNPAQEFNMTSGYVVFAPGQLVASIPNSVRVDTTPEVAAPATLTLRNISTSGVSSVPAVGGAAELDSTMTTAVITLRASNMPHGQVAFAGSSLKRTVNEGSAEINVTFTIVREFGSIDDIIVTYEAFSINESLTTVSPGQSAAAIPGDDFDQGIQSVVMADGVTSTTIHVTVYNDDVAELKEVFLVNLTGASLAPSDSTAGPPAALVVQPTIAEPSSAEVTIPANDGTNGQLHFDGNSTLVSVSEDVGFVNLTVSRTQGLFGQVSVFFFATAESVTPGSIDFTLPTNRLLVFNDGVDSQTISIGITADQIPEINEKFSVTLTGESGGATIGTPSVATVTILANDNANGIIDFAVTSQTATLREPVPGNSSGSAVTLTVMRTAGLFGEVQVPFSVESAGRSDLSPTTGTIVFLTDEDIKTFTISASMDTIPELTETYSVTLMPPSGGSVLGQRTTANITILENSDPHGVMQLFFSSDASATSIDVEENVGVIPLVVRRSQGSFGAVSVQWSVNSGTATSAGGSMLNLGSIQTIQTSNIRSWYSYTAGNTVYMLAASSSMSTGPIPIPGGSPVALPSTNSAESALYYWDGQWLKLQSIAANGARAWISWIADSGDRFFAVANFGSPGRTEVQSQVFQMTNGFLQQLQAVPTIGAVDVKFFSTSTEEYLFFVNMQDNSNSTNVDSALYRLTDTGLALAQSISTFGATSCEIFTTSDSETVLVVTGAYDSIGLTAARLTRVYVWRGSRFQAVQYLATNNAQSVKYFSADNSDYILIANRDLADITKAYAASLFRWNAATNVFVAVSSNLMLRDARQLNTFRQGGGLFVTVASPVTGLTVYQFNSTTASFTMAQSSSLTGAVSVEPVTIATSSFNTTVLMVARETAGQTEVLQSSLISDQTDFVDRGGVLTFKEQETERSVSVRVLNDAIPEIDESFSIQITSPTGGSILGTQTSLACTILTNDNAHGLLGFQQSSLSTVVNETSANQSVVLTVNREGGQFGDIDIDWSVAGAHNTGSNIDIHPTSGVVTVKSGTSSATITLTVYADNVAELNEVSTITLNSIMGRGGVAAGGDLGRRATLQLGRVVSVLTVLANDEPHGVVQWAPGSTSVTHSEVDNMNVTFQLQIVREFGLIGDILVYYETANASSYPTDQQAVADVDYVSISNGVVEIADDASTAMVSVSLLHENIPELAETFIVNITGVQLKSEASRMNSSTASPRVASPGNELATVTIRENDESRGILNVDATLNSNGELLVTEGTNLVLTVRRSSGSFGTIGCSWKLTALTSSLVDVSGPVNGVLTWNEREVVKTISLVIFNDDIPEIVERFSIELFAPTGGARLGSQSMIVVAIDQNDFANGLIGFAGQSLTVSVPEATSPSDTQAQVMLTVLRSFGTFGFVNASWSLLGAASDLSPVSGSVFFLPNETSQNIVINSLPDIIPEGEERFTIALTATSGGASLRPGFQQATIIIPANDDAFGIFSISPVTGDIYTAEGANVAVNIVRGGGTFRDVRVSYRISAADAKFADDTASTFFPASGTVTFLAGSNTSSVVLRVLSDVHPEEARSYTFQLTQVDNGGRLGTINTASRITVVASNNPHGTVQIASSLLQRVAEDVGSVSFTLTRTGGSIGPIRVDYTVGGGLATLGSDYTSPPVASVILNSTVISSVITIPIVNDPLPELTEDFFLVLTSVQFIGGPLNTTVLPAGYPVNIAPTLGLAVRAQVDILENDNAHGVIEFALTSTAIDLHEGAGLYTLQLMRTGGLFGAVSVQYMALNLSAHGNGVDFGSLAAPSAGVVIFAANQSTASLDLVIIDDQVAELQERFQIRLQNPTNGAVLGTQTLSTITISSSDDPSGIFGFSAATLSGFVVNNPSVASGASSIRLTLERSAGLNGNVTVFYDLFGSDPSRLHTDILPIQGSVTFLQGQQSSAFDLNIVADDMPELEEVFYVRLTRLTGGGRFNASNVNTTITIRPHNNPHGVISFTGQSLLVRSLSEPAAGSTSNLTFTVTRADGLFGSVAVSWSVTGTKLADIKSSSGVATLAEGQRTASFIVEILPDATPELEQRFYVMLSAPTGGALLGTQLYSNFSVLANDVPHGSFQLIPGGQSVVVNRTLVNAGVSAGRYIQLSVLRQLGLIGNVTVSINITFAETPSHLPTSYLASVFAPSGQGMISTTIAISPSFFFQPTSTFVVAIAGVSMAPGSQAPGNPPVVGAYAREVLTITELDSNSICSFATSSLQLAVDDSAASGMNNVMAAVTRAGLLGDVSVSWRSVVTGSNSSTLSPATGSVMVADTTRMMSFGVTATPTSSSLQDAAAMSLLLEMVTTSTVGSARLAAASLQASIEPHGVVRLAPNSQQLSVLEASGASITLTVWRQYGAAGNITVFYATRALASATDKALPGSDYTAVNSSLTMYAGQTIATVRIDITNDDIPEDTEQFQVFLVSVRRADGMQTVPASPRLHSTLTTSVVTITDDDDPSGVFSLAPSSSNLQLSEGQSMSIIVDRMRGQFGPASVTISTVVLTSVVADQRASTSDFVPISTVLMFANGQKTANVTLSIINDNIPEINETFGIALSSPTGGARLSATPDTTSTTVVIPGNDNQYGDFGFKENYTVTVNEDTSPSVSLTILRNAGTFGSAVIHWITRRDPTGTAGGFPEQLVAHQGDVVFQQGDKEKSFQITLSNDTIPEPASTFYIFLQTVMPDSKAILGSTRLARINSQSNDAADGVYEFDQNSRLVVAEPGAGSVTLLVTRPSGLSASSVQCRPIPLTAVPMIYGEEATAARPNVDYIFSEAQTLSFSVGQTSGLCQVSLIPKMSQTDIAPSVFNVTLVNPGGLATLGEYHTAEVVVTYSNNIREISDFRDTIENTPTPQDIENVIAGVAQLPKKVDRGIGIEFFVALVDRLIDVAQLCTSKNNAVNMMTVFDEMLQAPSFVGFANYSVLVTKFAYATVRCDPCPSDPKTYPGVNLNVVAQSVRTYSGLQFTGSTETGRPGDTFSFPTISGLERVDVANRSLCYSVHFVEYLQQTNSWFTSSTNNAAVLSNKVLSVNVQYLTSTVLPYDVTYRIHTSESRVTNRGGSCLFWDYNVNDWSDSTCVRQTPSSGADLQYIECRCKHLPDLAARAAADSRVGFGVAARISCFVVMGVMFIIIVLHHSAHREKMMVATKLFLHLIFAIMAMEVILVASFYQASRTGVEGCFALGYLIHFFGLAQFVWMAVLGYNFYRTFIFEDDETDRLYIRYIVTGWLLPTVIACAYIGVAIGGLGWTASRTYGDVYNAGDLCFLTDIYGALFSGVAPVVLCLAAVCYFFIVMYSNSTRKSKWASFDDFYLECDNSSEIPRLLLLFLGVFLTWVFASLHIAFGKDWTYALFVVFNFLLAAYALVMYSLVRWQALRTKGSFSPEDQSYPLGQVPTSLSTSKHSLTSLGSKKQLVLHRQISALDDPGHGRPFRASVASQQSYGTGQLPMEADGYPMAADHGALPEDDGNEFDDLMYMLKTGGSLAQDEDDNGAFQEAEAQMGPGFQNGGAASAEHYQMRRISIADTHL